MSAESFTRPLASFAPNLDERREIAKKVVTNEAKQKELNRQLMTDLFDSFVHAISSLRPIYNEDVRQEDKFMDLASTFSNLYHRLWGAGFTMQRCQNYLQAQLTSAQVMEGLQLSPIHAREVARKFVEAVFSNNHSLHLHR